MSVHTKTRRTERKTQRRASGNVPWRESFRKRIYKHSEGGAVLRGCRFKEGVSQREFAKVIGISQHHVSEMENGKRTIGKEMAKRFAAFFKNDYRIFL